MRNNKGQFIKGFSQIVLQKTRNKISEALKGHSVDQETRAKIKNTLTGRKLSPEHRNKLKEIMSKRDQNGINNPNYKHGLRLDRTYMNFQKYKNKLKRRGIKALHTLEEWEQLKQTYTFMYLCCKKTEPKIKLTKDHIIPLSKGGTDNIWNIQPLCGSGNSQKWAIEIDYRERLVI